MHIAYTTAYDAQNVLSWSGVPYHMAKALKNQCESFSYIGPLKEKYSLLFKAKQVLYKGLTNKSYRRDREPIILKGYAQQIQKQLNTLKPDIVFSPSTIPVSYLECDQPIVVWPDTTFAGLLNFYPEYTNVCKETVENAVIADKLALNRASLILYQSDWGAQTAIEKYGIDPAKIRVVPYGANIECDRTIFDIKDIVDRRPSNVCKLLFYGADWYRKGGDIAIKVAKKLNEAGLPTELKVIGGKPDSQEPLPNFVELLGFISKTGEQGRNTIEKLISEAHFLILPTRADCSPIAFPEANSFGVPCLTTNVGGISTAVKDGLNGKTFNVTASPEEYCDYVLELFRDYRQYKQLALSSFDEFQSRLNWSVAGNTVKNLLTQLLDAGSVAKIG
jgi:glycosyltransferase involved in cell wall biosynthesis